MTAVPLRRSEVHQRRNTAILDAIRAQDSRVVGVDQKAEIAILSCLLFMFYVSFGALGRDIFYNHLQTDFRKSTGDPIGGLLPFLRPVICGTAFLYVTMRTDLRWVLSKVPWQLAPFCIWATATCLWSDDPKAAFRNGITTTAMWLSISPLIHRLGLARTVRVTMILMSIICLSSFLLAVFVPSIGRHTGLEATQQSHKGEWRGIFSHKNVMGPWMAWGAAFLATYARLGGRFRLYWWLAGAAGLVALFKSNSATSLAMFAMLAGLQGLFYGLRRFTVGTMVLVALPTIALAGVVAVIAPDLLFTVVGRDDTFTGRTDIWKICLDQISQNPFLGAGFMSSGGDVLLNRLFAISGQPLGPENGYISMLLEVGAIGFTLFFVPYALALKNGFEWLRFSTETDRSCIEVLISILMVTLLASYTLSDITFATGNDGVCSFVALFALLTLPKSPPGVLRGEWRMAKYRLPSTRRRARSGALPT